MIDPASSTGFGGRDNAARLQFFCERYGEALWVFFGSALAAHSVMALLWVTSPRLVLAIASIVSLIWSSARFERLGDSHSRWSGAMTAAAVAGTVILSIAAARSYYDISCDGSLYHQAAIQSLAQGWNPIHDPALPVPPNENVWINHYPKAPWVLASLWVSAFGGIEHGKATNLLLLAGSFALALSALLSLRVRPRYALPVALAMALNPVTITQSLSTYVDGQLASALLSFGALLVLYYVKPSPRRLLALSACIAYTENIKFTALPYLVVAGATALLLMAVDRRPGIRSGLVVLGMAGLFGLLVIGFNPYVRNTFEQGHPLHPLFGARKIDIMSWQVPYDFWKQNRVAKMAQSLAARSSNPIVEPPAFKVPFTVTPQELQEFGIPDVRFGGFGPLFGGTLLLALLCLALAAAVRALDRPVLAICGALLLSVLMNPEGWWARYAPQLWLLPALLAAAALASGNRLARLAGLVVTAALLINSTLVGLSYLAHQSGQTQRLGHQLRALAAQSADHAVRADVEGRKAALLRLQEAGVRIASVGPLVDCSSRVEIEVWPPMHLCVNPPDRLQGAEISSPQPSANIRQ